MFSAFDGSQRDARPEFHVTCCIHYNVDIASIAEEHGIFGNRIFTTRNGLLQRSRGMHDRKILRSTIVQHVLSFLQRSVGNSSQAHSRSSTQKLYGQAASHIATTYDTYANGLPSDSRASSTLSTMTM